MVSAALDPKSSLPVPMGRLLFLGFSSIFVYFITLFVPYLVSFSAFPLVIAMTYYKRHLSFGLIVSCLVVVFFLLRIFDSNWTMVLFPLYMVTSLIAVVVGEILLREIPPRMAILGVGVFLVIMIFILGQVVVYYNKGFLVELFRDTLITVQDQLVSRSSDGGGEIKDYIQVLVDRVDEIVIATPAYIFISVFLGVWVNLYLTLRNHRVLFFLRRYPYKLKDLTNLRLPFWVAYVVIGLLFFYVFPLGIGGEYFQTFLLGAFYVIGTFLFLQGFGVYLEYFDFFKVRGFLRPLLLFFAVVFANTILALVGLFDLWFDFRRFFQRKGKNKDKGKIL